MAGLHIVDVLNILLRHNTPIALLQCPLQALDDFALFYTSKLVTRQALAVEMFLS